MGLLTWLRQEAQLKKMVLVIVFLALFLDHMLLSVVVPILPNYLYSTGQAANTTSGNSTIITVNPPIIQSLSNRSVILGSTFGPPHQNTTLSSDPSVALKSPESNCSDAEPQLDEVNIKIGLLLASKSMVQLIINPFMGPLTDRIGYHIPVCAGFCIVIIATFLFAFSSNYILLLLARSVQGVGGSCLSVAGMGMLADVYKDVEDRGRAMGISFTGLALGLIAGAPFGSVMYQFLGKMVPFLVLAAIAVLGGASDCLALILDSSRPLQTGGVLTDINCTLTMDKYPIQPLFKRSKLFTCPHLQAIAGANTDGKRDSTADSPQGSIYSHCCWYFKLNWPTINILSVPPGFCNYAITTGAICFTTLIIATIETALPVWMMKTMCASKWQLGTVFLPDSLSYLIASNIFGHLSQKHSVSWLCACVGMVVAGITTISFGFSKNIYHLLVQNAFVGFSIGIVDSSLMPLMAYLVDLRYVPVYGTVYAIADVAICVGFCIGPAIAGPIVASIGFPWLMTLIGAVNIIFAPLCIFLFNPPLQDEHLSILTEN